ncbi:plasmid stabilization protein [Spiribacter roseus]|jgi:predicted nucleic acid-binding protein|uniref:Ribonuclease VapC n=1 Tax=Spiribacter roseus TaxID=1855875 RepID=A0ABV3RYM6_9GAMM|nr:plasmid stabilization protein [Spiribacter roseus]
MIILDTNVLSEVLKPSPAKAVVDWLACPPRSTFFTTAVVEAELRYGVGILDAGERRDQLQAALDGIFLEDFRARVIPFDRECAEAFSQIAAHRRRIGRPISQFDAMIAAAAASRGAQLATRNTRDFADCGIEVIDPWVDAPI